MSGGCIRRGVAGAGIRHLLVKIAISIQPSFKLELRNYDEVQEGNCAVAVCKEC